MPIGIGLEFSRVLLERGANVLFADLALRAEAEALVCAYSHGNPRALFKKTDVTAWHDLEKMFSTAEDEFGGVDIVCPGAGVYEPLFSNFWYPPGTSLSKDNLRGDRYKLLDINITHPIRATQMAISYFLSASPPPSPSNPKTIVHIASVAGEGADLKTPLYHTSKHAIIGFVRCLADLEETCGIRVAAVAPGVVKTPLWLDDPQKRRLLKEEGENKDEWITPHQVAQVMLSIVEKYEVSSVPVDVASTVNAGESLVIKGGTILEVTSREVREVPLFNNSGPFGKPGTTVSHEGELWQETVGLLKPGWGKL